MSFWTIPLSPDDKPDSFVLLSMYEKLESENAKLRELVRDLLNAWDDVQREVVTGPSFGECERRAYELGIEVG